MPNGRMRTESMIQQFSVFKCAFNLGPRALICYRSRATCVRNWIRLALLYAARKPFK